MKTTYDKVMTNITTQQAELDKRRQFILSLQPKLEQLNLDVSGYGTQIDFDRLDHPDILKVILAFGGKWDKTPSFVETKIDYQLNLDDGGVVRCWAGTPPPSCKIIEEVVVVPEHVVPATTKTVRKLQCV